MRWWRRKPAVSRMLDEHLEKKCYAERAKLRAKHKEKLYELESIDHPKDAVVIKRKNIWGFIAGFISVILIVTLIGSAYAVFYAGNQQIISTVATGTAPFQVSSTTKVTNLNADLIDGYDSSTLVAKSCKPYARTVTGSSTAWVQGYSCTSCAGWLQGVRMRHEAGDLGYHTEVILEIDGTNTSTFSTYDPLLGTFNIDRGFFAWGRYTSSFKVYIREAANHNSYNPVALITDCRE